MRPNSERRQHVGARDDQGRVRGVRTKRSFGALRRYGSRHHLNEAEGNPLADRNPYVGGAAIGEGVFGRILGAIDDFTAVPSTFIDGGDHVVVLGRYGGVMKAGGATLDAAFCHVYGFRDGKVVSFQQYTDTEQWTRLMR